ncbi:MAG: helicase-related protein [Erysipelotrichaceae bacterium]|nr:helicase-related protein [Erysipelotrichaceae bacterium]
MECKRCGNKDPAYFYEGHKGIYCRKCIGFKRILLDEDTKSYEYSVSENVEKFYFDYPLTRYQQEVSDKCRNLIKEKDVLLHCVCGAGKTELVVETISDFLKEGKKVCYAISRKEVVIELEKRFRAIFRDASVIGVYGGHHDVLSGDLIVCTTHQLFRYQKTFDLLIIDEVDAFPLKGNYELMHIAINSAKGNIIYSTATVNDFLLKSIKKRNYEELTLFIRPSLKPLIEPLILYSNKFFLLLYMFRLMQTMTNQCIIFVSSKKECRRLYSVLKHLFSITYVYAESSKRKENIEDFRNKKYQFILATTVLERGITIKDVNVIILCFHKGVFDEGSLVQMLGRVGRNFLNPYGEAYILSCFRDEEINKADELIKRANKEYEMSILRQGN